MEQLASAKIQAAANDLIINMNENFESQMEHQDKVLANDITKNARKLKAGLPYQLDVVSTRFQLIFAK
jgi:hypothetical protein